MYFPILLIINNPNKYLKNSFGGFILQYDVKCLKFNTSALIYRRDSYISQWDKAQSGHLSYSVLHSICRLLETIHLKKTWEDMQKYTRQNMQFKDSNTMIVNRHKLFLGSIYQTYITHIVVKVKWVQPKFKLIYVSPLWLFVAYLLQSQLTVYEHCAFILTANTIL